MSKGATRALIVGGGIGGMAAAIALRRQGAEVELVDIDPEWKVYGAGITITGPTLRAFRDLGLFEAIQREGFFSVGGHMFLYDGTLLSKTVTPPIEPGLPASGGIMRPKLHQIMSSAVRNAGAKVRLGVTVGRLEQDEDGAEVELSDGSAGRFDLIVGADGIYSDLRAKLFESPVAPVYTGQMSWRVVAPRPPEMDVAHFFFGHKYVGGINPCSQGEVYAFILHREPEPRRIPDGEKAAFLRDLMADFGGSMAVVRDGLGPHSSIVQRPFEYAIQPRPWHKGRVVLIGDAAHATTPHLASGAGMAVEDALVLAEELDRAGGDVPAALEAFTGRRYDRCKFIVDSSVGIAARQLEGAPAEEIGMRMGQAMGKLAEPI
ncbi:FAD-dependent monooxygenase [Sphingosinicella terrae]|uniref:FAD-dependent monooxygenase n=1 Tax=Sphingosinicella terrae TaxID=2172047 RepID=UPI000E0DF3CF|nr:FAD-dependent monooxygenase [Sphingosinicella terrae]